MDWSEPWIGASLKYPCVSPAVFLFFFITSIQKKWDTSRYAYPSVSPRIPVRVQYPALIRHLWAVSLHHRSSQLITGKLSVQLPGLALFSFLALVVWIIGGAAGFSLSSRQVTLPSSSKGFPGDCIRCRNGLHQGVSHLLTSIIVRDRLNQAVWKTRQRHPPPCWQHSPYCASVRWWHSSFIDGLFMLHHHKSHHCLCWRNWPCHKFPQIRLHHFTYSWGS
jgi:hypothetical protein